ncbi:hypothetical protein V6L78_19700 [Pseudomonas canadensis]|uniref:hypothetical protein n=1 Tax=Pseudomonas canadensis TaxID=915099 RepID=UPI0030D1E968
MTITPLNLGSAANDGNGQNLRSGGQVINANFAELDERTSAASLKAIGAVPPDANTFVYFNGSTTAASAVLTTKARALLARTDTAGMQAELALVPVTSTTDRTAGRLLTPGSGGILGAPVPVPNANNITFLGGTHGIFSGTEAQCVAANYPALGGAGTESRRWFIDTDLVDGASARQTATENLGAGAATRKGRTFTRVLDTSWQPWIEIAKSGDFGLGLTHVTPMTNIDIGSPGSDQFFSTPQTAGTKPFDYGFVRTYAQANNNFFQVAYEIVATTARVATRVYAGGSWRPWAVSYDAVNSLLDPQTAGGLMSSSTVGAWVITKYLNGDMFATGSVGNSPSIPVNTVGAATITIPSGFVGEIIGHVMLQPAGNTDCYGLAYSYFSTATSLVAGIRNGATGAQAFLMRVMIKGRWK